MNISLPIQSEVIHPSKTREWLTLSALQIDRHWCMVIVTGTCFYRQLCRKRWPVSNLAELSITFEWATQGHHLVILFFFLCDLLHGAFKLYCHTCTGEPCDRLSDDVWEADTSESSFCDWKCLNKVKLLKAISSHFWRGRTSGSVEDRFGQRGHRRRRLFKKRTSENGRSEAHTVWSYIFGAHIFTVWHIC